VCKCENIIVIDDSTVNECIMLTLVMYVP